MAAANQLAVQFHKSTYNVDHTIGYAVFMGVRPRPGTGGIDNAVFGPAADAVANPGVGNPLPTKAEFPKGSYYILAVYLNLNADGDAPGTFAYGPPGPVAATGIAIQLADNETITFYAVAAFTNLQGATNAIDAANRAAAPGNLVEAIDALNVAVQLAGPAVDPVANPAAAAGSLAQITNGNNFNLWYIMNGHANLQLHLENNIPGRETYVYTIALQLQHYNPHDPEHPANIDDTDMARVDELNATADLNSLARVYGANNPNALQITLRPIAPVAVAPTRIAGGSYSTPQYSIGGRRYKTSRTYKKKRSNKNKKNKNDTRK